MLSDHERRELGRIEDGLAGDRWLVDVLDGDGRAGRRRWPIRALVCFGILLLSIGILTAGGMLVLQGLLIGGAGIAWSRWRVWRSRPRSTGADRERSSPRPFGPPPE
jgi:hypothetical protein